MCCRIPPARLGHQSVVCLFAIKINFIIIGLLSSPAMLLPIVFGSKRLNCNAKLHCSVHSSSAQLVSMDKSPLQDPNLMNL